MGVFGTEQLWVCWAVPIPETQRLPAPVLAWYLHHATSARGASGDSWLGPRGQAWPQGEQSVGRLRETQGWVHPSLSTIPPWGQAGGSVPTHCWLQTCPSRWVLWRGQHWGCLSPPHTPRLVRGDPGMPKVKGVGRSLGAQLSM